MKFDGHIPIDHPSLVPFKKGFFTNTDTNEKLWFYIYPCYAMASYTAYEIAKIKNFCYLIESNSHAVAYDGIDTWDLKSGFVVRNFRYPRDDFSLDKVEYLHDAIRPKKFIEEFYSKEVLEVARSNHVNISRLKYYK
jgi:hypothetical protein